MPTPLPDRDLFDRLYAAASFYQIFADADFPGCRRAMKEMLRRMHELRLPPW